MKLYTLIKQIATTFHPDKPRAVAGIVNIWARPLFDADILSLAVPYEEYKRMEENSKDCFL